MKNPPPQITSFFFKERAKITSKKMKLNMRDEYYTYLTGGYELGTEGKEKGEVEQCLEVVEE